VDVISDRLGGRLLLALLFVGLGGGVALTTRAAAAQSSAEPLRVVIKPLTPFVMREGEDYRGFSIDLWREIAVRNGWQYQFQWVESVTDQLAAVQRGDADVAIAGISMTPDREQLVDFSFPMFNGGLQVLTTGEKESALGEIFVTFTRGTLLAILLFIGLIILAGGHVIWLVQRTRDPKWPQGYFRGVWEGVWVAGSTLVTSDVGEHAPRSVTGRVVALLWMFFAVILIAYFTAVATSSLTVKQIQGAINGPDDLSGKAVMSVTGSTASDWLRNRGIAHEDVTSVDEAYPLLRRREIDAIVYDAPVLRYYALTAGKGRVRVVGSIFDREDYGIALAIGSRFRKPINLTLLEIREDGTYQRLYNRWFGAPEGER